MSRHADTALAAELGSDGVPGRRICLRPLTVEDVGEAYVRWMNDPEVTRFLECRFTSWSHERLAEYVTQMADNPDCGFWAIILTESRRHIGNIKIGPCNRFHHYADVGIVLGEKSEWGKGYAAEAIQLVTDFAFRRLHLNKLYAGIYSTNIGCVRAFEKAGYRQAGVLRKHRLSGGTFVDQVLVEILNKDSVQGDVR